MVPTFTLHPLMKTATHNDSSAKLSVKISHGTSLSPQSAEIQALEPRSQYVLLNIRLDSSRYPNYSRE